MIRAAVQRTAPFGGSCTLHGRPSSCAVQLYSRACTAEESSFFEHENTFSLSAVRGRAVDILNRGTESRPYGLFARRPPDFEFLHDPLDKAIWRMDPTYNLSTSAVDQGGDILRGDRLLPATGAAVSHSLGPFVQVEIGEDFVPHMPLIEPGGEWRPGGAIGDLGAADDDDTRVVDAGGGHVDLGAEPAVEDFRIPGERGGVVSEDFGGLGGPGTAVVDDEWGATDSAVAGHL